MHRKRRGGRSLAAASQEIVAVGLDLAVAPDGGDFELLPSLASRQAVLFAETLLSVLKFPAARPVVQNLQVEQGALPQQRAALAAALDLKCVRTRAQHGSDQHNRQIHAHYQANPQRPKLLDQFHRFMEATN